MKSGIIRCADLGFDSRVIASIVSAFINVGCPRTHNMLTHNLIAFLQSFPRMHSTVRERFWPRVAASLL